MSLSALDQEIFALDRRARLEIVIDGVPIKGGLGEQGNIDSTNVEFDLEQIPPTAAIAFPKEQLTALASGLPPWIELGHTVDIDAGYGNEIVRIFTGRVKARRHGVDEDVLDCVGRTGKLTRPYRVEPPKRYQAYEARAAILDILDDYGVDFTEIAGEKTDIDPILMNDGNPWMLGTVVEAILDMAPPSDMIRKIADVYGHRMYELPDGTLRIRPLLEAPAMSGFRTYTTRIAGSGTTTQSTLTYAESNIDAAALLGNVAANTQRSQGFLAATSGGPAAVGMWVRKVGAPTDQVRIRILKDASGLPSTAADAVIGSGTNFLGSTLDLVTYTVLPITINSGTQLVLGATYHLVIDRTGALDAVNYYEVGIDQTAPGYANGQAGVFDGAIWTAEDAGGDGADHPFQVITNAFAALRVLDIGDDEDEDQIKKLVIVHGASISDFNAEGDEITTIVTGIADTDNEDLVPGLDELFALEYQNDLIDTVVVANEVALRLIDKFGRALQSIELEVPFDPRMALGSTITIDDPAVTGLGGNWWVHGYAHVLSATEALTRLSLFGGDQSGVTGELSPTASFTWKIESELIGNTVQTIITFTAVAFDQDGWITNYHWVDDYAGGAHDVQGGDLTIVTFSYNPAVDPAITMTLTVTDNTGRTTSVPHTINLQTTNEELYVPLITCAAGNTCMYSNDGAASWHDIATPSGEARATAILKAANINDPPILFYGTTTGRIYRSLDENATLVLEYTDADGDAITEIKVDIGRQGMVWATTTDRVLFSRDWGDTWNVYTDFNNSANWLRTTTTTVMAAAGIDASVALGDATTRVLWATQLDPAITGQLGSASFWLRRVGNPTDSVRLSLVSNSGGTPNVVLATSGWVAGSSISNAALVQITFTLSHHVESSTTYHLMIERSGSPDAANHYLVATNNLGNSDFFDSVAFAWTAVADSLVFQATIMSSAGHVNPNPVDPRPINTLEVSDPVVNRIWIFGGRGSVVESWVGANYLPSGGGQWFAAVAQGDGLGAFPRDAADTVVDFVVSNADSGDLGLVFRRTGAGVPPNPYIYSETFYPVGEAGWRIGRGAMAGVNLDGVGAEANNHQSQKFLALLDNRTAYVTLDGVGWWPIPDVLPGTVANRPHDLLSITAWQDVFLAAMDEGIAKTIDFGVTWAFLRPVGAPINTTWPVGAVGWKLAIEYRRPSTNSADIAAIVLSHAADPIVENALAIRTSAGWEDHGPVPTGRNDRPHRLWHFPQISDQVLFHVLYEAAVLDHQQAIYRTPDQGATWVSTALAPSPMIFSYAMARSPNGDLWATGESHAGLHAGNAYPHEIFRSIDDGLTWVKIFEDTTTSFGVYTMYKDIAVDPNDPDRIMAVGLTIATNVTTLLSTNADDGAASSWTRTASGLSFDGIAPRYCTPFIMAGQNGRWIIGFNPNASNRRRIYTNDQNGVPAAWTLRYDVLLGAATFGFADRIRAGNILYVIGSQIDSVTQIPLLRSLNNGNDWEVVATHTALRAMAWNADANMIIAGRSANSTRFPYITPVEPQFGDPWKLGIDTGLEAAMGYGAGTPCSVSAQGMAILRGVAGTVASRYELWAIAQVAAGGGDTDIWLREAVSDSWRNYLDMPDTAAAENRFPIWHFPGMGNVMFRLKIGNLGSAADGYGGPLERSDNRGLTWTTVLTNVGALTRGPNGYLWATRDDRAAPASFQPRSIYRSIDNGIIWTIQATDATASGGLFTKYTQIRVDPSNPARVMAVGGLGNAATMRYAYSSTGLGIPAVFTFASAPMSFRNGTAADGVFINLEAGGAGRFILGLSQADGLAKFIYVTDDHGANWVQKYTVVTTAVTLGWVDSLRAGADLYLAGNGGGASNAVDGRVVRSSNNGDTWTPFTGDDRTDIMAITWHGASSTLFIGRAIAGAGNVLRMQNPLPASVWVADSIPSDPRMIMQEGLKVVT